jgi:polyhydroxybutyrate depolymerase
VALVIALYGATGCPQCMQGLTHFEELGASRGFVVAYPGSNTDPPWHSPADITYFNALIDRIVANQNIDPRRIYLAGFSAGGRETYYMACRLSARIAAAASVSSIMRPYPCAVSHPVSELTIVGSTEPELSGTPTIPSAFETAARWRSLDGCRRASKARITRVSVVTMQVWGPCSGGSAVGLFVVSGGHHTWPGTYGLAATDPDARWNASKAIWSFFSTHPLAR